MAIGMATPSVEELEAENDRLRAVLDEILNSIDDLYVHELGGEALKLALREARDLMGK
jgi:hypothetical protein